MSTTEIQGMLARLLATENLLVEHRQVSTASFDIDRRILTLPMWDGVSKSVYDMLVAHEVGHALFTPLREWKRERHYKSIPFSYVNIIEDARIEALMKHRYPGLIRDFHHGYKALNHNDFFELNGKDVNTFLFIDRINLYFKVGSLYDIKFNDKEADIVTQISKCRTFDQVLVLAMLAYSLEKEQQKDAIEAFRQGEKEGQGESGDQGNMEQSDNQGDEGEHNPDLDTPSYESGQDGELDPDGEEPESETQKSFDKNLRDLRNQNSSGPTYMTLPDVILDKVIYSVDRVKADMERHFELCKNLEKDGTHENNMCRESVFHFEKEYKQFKLSARKGVNALVKEFEMRKSADSYARTTIARTGVLDTGKLHTYKYNEDLFRKVSITTDGKNHSLIFVLDWSGSMANEMLSTVKQLFQLLWFCRKVSIPFEVYAFTNEAWRADDNPEDHKNCEWRENDLYLGKEFRMVNLISSNMKPHDFDQQLEYVWLTAVSFTHWIHTPFGYGLSGTPINEAIVCVGKIAKEYQKKTKTQKCNVVFLTDGEGNHSGMNVRQIGYDDVERNSATAIRWNTIIRHKSHTFNIDGMGAALTNTLLRAIKVDNPTCNFMAFRLFAPNDMVSLYRQYGTESYSTYDDMRQEMRKHGSVSFTTPGFDRWFGIPIKNLSTSEELAVDEGAKKSDVSKAFRKMHTSKRSNKYIVKSFMEQIA